MTAATITITVTVTITHPPEGVLDDLEQGLDVIASDRCCSKAERDSLEPARAWLAELRKALTDAC